VSWEFFDHRVCLTTVPDEWPIGLAEFERVGLSVEKFQSIPDIGPHQSFNHSIRRILADFYHSDAKSLLHLEDDCIFRNLEHLDTALSELPADWDVVYLGANLVCWNNGEPWPERYSDHLFRTKVAWTTHAVGFSKNAAKFILEKQPGFSESMLDNWLSLNLGELNAFVVAPMVAHQRARVSSIWGTGKIDDYTPIFEASQERLK
jgi:hypothetical protein